MAKRELTEQREPSCLHEWPSRERGRAKLKWGMESSHSQASQEAQR